MNSEFDIIDLAEEERELGRALLDQAGRPDRGSSEYGLYFVSATGQFGSLGRSVEAEVFFETFGNDRTVLAGEYTKYEHASFFMLVIDHDSGTPAGVVRVIENSHVGLKTLNDIASTPGWGATWEQIRSHHHLGGMALDRVWDIATLAVRKRWRASLVGPALYHGVYVGSRIADKDRIVVALDDNVLDVHQAFGMPWERVCNLPSVNYLDSQATSPLTLDMVTVADILGPASEIGKIICYGEGLSGAVSRPVLPVDRVISPVDLEPELATQSVRPTA